MDDTAAVKELTPGARARRPKLFGTPVRLRDDLEWRFSAMPVGPAGDPVAAVMRKLAEAEAELEIVTSRQETEFERDTEHVLSDEDEEKARGTYRRHQDRIEALESAVRELQAQFVFLALSLNYEVTEEEAVHLVDLRAFRQIHGVVVGAPQLEEIREAAEAMRGGSGN